MKTSSNLRNSILFVLFLICSISAKSKTRTNILLNDPLVVGSFVNNVQDSTCFVGTNQWVTDLLNGKITLFEASVPSSSEIKQLINFINSIIPFSYKPGRTAAEATSIINSVNVYVNLHLSELKSIVDELTLVVGYDLVNEVLYWKRFTDSIRSVAQIIINNEGLSYYLQDDLVTLTKFKITVNQISFLTPSACFPISYFRDYDSLTQDLNQPTISSSVLANPSYTITNSDISAGDLIFFFKANVSYDNIFNNQKTLFSIINNLNIIKLELSDNADHKILFNFKVGDQTFSIPNLIECTDIVSLYVKIEKTFVNYRVVLVIKSISLNSRYQVSIEVPSTFIEGATISVNSYSLIDSVIKARFYNQSTANIEIEREMELYYNTLVSVSQQNQIISDCSLIPTDCLFFNSDECLFCQTGSFLNSNTGICVLTCPDGYFGNSTTNTCDVCAEKCATCTSLTNGLTPILGKVIYQGICLDTCPNGTFAVDGVCQICTSNCLTCADSTTCSVCQTGYLLNGLCFDSCPTGYYIITSPNNQCGACEANCDQCTDSTTCTKCSATYYLYNADCYSVCPDGTYKCDVDNTCKDCPAECATCSDKNTCLSCEAGFSLKDNQCLTNCPTGFVSVSGYCVPCGTNCNICLAENTSICTECNSTSYLKSGVCVSDCGIKFYVDGSRVCQPCITNCDVCSNGTTCTTCTTGFNLLNSNQCVSPCPSGYVASSGVCLLCDPTSNCKTCNPLDLSECTVCFDGDFLHNKVCIDVCPTATFPSGNICPPCILNCDVCNNSSTCITCSTGFYLKDGVCVSDCGDGYTIVGDKCLPCNTLYCKDCDADINTCVECVAGKVLQNGVCQDSCNIGFYANDGICYSCLTNCQSCDNGTTCNECVDPYFLKQDKSDCLVSCPIGFVGVDKKCLPCLDTNCNRCATDQTTCTICDSAYYLYEGDCLSSCPLGTFPVESPSKICTDCPVECEACTSLTHCTDCINGYVLNPDFTCKNNCPPFYANVSDVCQPCTNTNCETCQTNLTTCVKCSNGTFLYLGDCVATCPDGFFGKDGVCLECPDNCKTCVCTTKCQICFDPYSLYNSLCVVDCPVNYVSVQETTGKVCKQCEQYCDQCSATDINTCLKCSTGTFLLNGDCLTACPSGYYQNTIAGTCDPCSVTNCDICSTGVPTCEKCKSPLLLKENTCVASCGDGYRQNGFVCEKCQVTDCRVCDTSVSTCDDCIDNYFLLDQYTCSDTCPISTYPVPAEQLCKPCDSKCLICSSATVCSECKVGFYLDGTTCLTECPVGKVEDAATKTCVPCEANCDECNPVDHTICLDCSAGFYLFEGNCLSVCPDGYYESISKGTCEPCQVLCATCSDCKTCDTCKVGYYLYQGQCVDNCPDHFVAVDGKCIECQTSTNCKKCSSTDLTQCIQCIDGLYLYNNQCLVTCPDGFRPLTNMTCDPCITNCEICGDALTCNKCFIPYVLLQDLTCASTCPSGQVAINYVCENCSDANCKVCGTDKVCTVCNDTWLLKSLNGVVTCVQDCGAGFYPNGSVCTPCTDVNCIACSGPSQCSDCDGVYSVLNSSSCVLTCPDGKTSINGVCEDCELGCKHCSSSDITQCTECYSPKALYLGDCLDNCPSGFVILTSNPTVCSPCGSNCLTCCPSDASKCLVCDSGFVIDIDNTCVTECRDGYTVVNNKCTPCQVDNCRTCDTDISTCDECNPPKVLSNDHLTCLESCPSAQYVLNGVCTPCNNCPSCEDGTGKCTDCYPGYFLASTGICKTNCLDGQVRVGDDCVNCSVTDCKHCSSPDVSTCVECFSPKYLYNNVCLTTCPPTTYPSSTPINTCLDCKPNCETCTSSTDCSKCIVGFVLQGQVCQTKCDDGFVNINGICTECTDSTECKVCLSSNLDKCKICKDGFFLKDGLCVSDCGASYFVTTSPATGGVCNACEQFCVQCNDATTCTKCQSDKVLYNYDCIDACPDGWIAIDGVCQKCSSSLCKVCSQADLTVCITCLSPYLLKDTVCVSNCGDGYFVDNGVCVPCNDSNCITCTSASVCVDCKDPFKVYNNGCVSQCPPGWVANSSDVCEKCTDDNCKVCEITNLGNCIECLYDNLFEEKCVPVCPPGYYAVDMVCLPCLTNCIDCTSSSNCFDCLDPNVLISNKCESNCPEKYVDINGTCEPCSDTGCLVCNTDKTTCTKCETPLLLFNNDCVSACPTGYFSNGTECVACETNCDQCTSVTACTKCTSGWYLYNEDCYNPCPDYTYEATDGTCKSCTDNVRCRDCLASNPSTCLDCSSGILYQGSCISECPPKTFYDPSIQTCNNCESNCSVCTSTTVCTQCDTTYLLLNEDCVTACPDEYVQIGTTCTKCGDGCKTCYTSDVNSCLTCISPLVFYQNTCIASCPAGTYQTTNTQGQQVCLDCNPKCSLCTSATFCTDCVDPFVLSSGACVDSCPDKTVDVNGVCTPCTDNVDCKKCLVDLSTCTECLNGTYLLNGQCLDVCPDGYYPNNTDMKCYPCLTTCKKCVNASQCTECKDGYYFNEDGSFTCVLCPAPNVIVGTICKTCKPENCDTCVSGNDLTCETCKNPWVLYNGSCLVSCPIGYFNLNGKCTPCESYCDQCTSTTDCTKCDSSHYLLEGSCVELCPPGYGVNNNRDCVDCTVQNCLSCDGNLPSICTDCEGAYILHENQCIVSCPDGHYHLPDDTCGDCPAFCKSCTDSTSCDICIPGYYLKEGQCVNSCGSGYFTNTITNTCDLCGTEHCCICNPAETCTKCESGYNLYQNTCIISCPDGYFVENGICKPCTSGCKVCTSTDDCSECINPSQVIYNSNTCVNSCPDGFTKVGKFCVPCSDTECKVCQPENPNICTECYTEYLLNNACITSCPEGYYADGSRICQPCYERCLTCDNGSTCLTCKPTFVFLNGSCLNTCPDGFYNSNGVCLPCGINNCDACYPQGGSIICTDCDSTHFLFENTCIIACPDGYYADEFNVCRECSVGALLCVSISEATLCDVNYFLYEGVCLHGCPNGFYGDCETKECKPCSVECETCYFNNADSCYLCAVGYHKDGLTCKLDSIPCPVGQYIDTISRTCKPCSDIPNCSECTSLINCTKCTSLTLIIVDGMCKLPTPESPDQIVSILPSEILSTPNSYQFQVDNQLDLIKSVSSGIVHKKILSIYLFVEKLFNRSVGEKGLLFSYFPNNSNVYLNVVDLKPDNKLKIELRSSVDGSIIYTIDGPSTDNIYSISLLKIVLNTISSTVIIDLEGQPIVSIVVPIDLKPYNTEGNVVFFYNHNELGSSEYKIHEMFIGNYLVASSTESTILGSRPLDNTTKLFTYVNNDLTPVSPFSIYLREIVGFDRNVFKTFAFETFIYLSEITQKYVFELNYDYTNVNPGVGIQTVPLMSLYIDNIDNPTVDVNGKVTLPSSLFKSETWYDIKVSYENGVFIINIYDKDLVLVHTYSLNMIILTKLFNELKITVGSDNNSIFKPVLSFNDTSYPRTLLATPEHCIKLDQSLNCNECEPFYKVTSSFTCEDISLKSGQQLFQFYESYNLKQVSQAIPSAFIGKPWSMTFALRKPTHSLIKSSPLYPLISFGSTVVVYAENKIGYKVALKIGTVETEFDFNDVIYDFINVVITFDPSAGNVKVYINNSSTIVSNTVAITADSPLILFSNAHPEISFEALDATIYPLVLSTLNINILLNKIRKDLDPLCKTGDYETGACSSCAVGTLLGSSKCSASFYGVNFLQKFGPDSILNTIVSKYQYKSIATNSVNSKYYALTTRFRGYKLKAIDNLTSGIYNIVTLRNVPHLNWETVDPSNDLIKLNIEVVNGIAKYVITINNSIETRKIIVDGLSFVSGQWLFFYSSIDVQNKKFRYKFLSTTVSIDQTVSLTNFPEKLQNVGEVSVFTGGYASNTGELIPDGETLNSFAIPNVLSAVTENDLITSILNYKPPVPVTLPPNTVYAIYNYSTKVINAIECVATHKLLNNACVPK